MPYTTSLFALPPNHRFLQRGKDTISHDKHAGSTKDHLLPHPVLIDERLTGFVGRPRLTPQGGNLQLLCGFEYLDGDLKRQ